MAVQTLLFGSFDFKSHGTGGLLIAIGVHPSGYFPKSRKPGARKNHFHSLRQLNTDCYERSNSSDEEDLHPMCGGSQQRSFADQNAGVQFQGRKAQQRQRAKLSVVLLGEENGREREKPPRFWENVCGKVLSIALCLRTLKLMSSMSRVLTSMWNISIVCRYTCLPSVSMFGGDVLLN